VGLGKSSIISRHSIFQSWVIRTRARVTNCAMSITDARDKDLDIPCLWFCKRCGRRLKPPKIIGEILPGLEIWKMMSRVEKSLIIYSTLKTTNFLGRYSTDTFPGRGRDIETD